MIFLPKRRQWLALMVGGCLVWGCSVKYQRYPQPGRQISAEKTLQQLSERWSAFKDARAKATITITQRGKKQKLGANIIFDSSYRFRMEGLGFGETPYFFLVSDSQQVWFYVPNQQKIWQGKASAENLFRLTGIRLGPKTLVNLFSGNIELSKNIPLKSGRGFVDFHFGQEGGWYRLWMDANRGVILKMQVYDADKKLSLTARFEDYEKYGGYKWPKRIECDFIPSKVQMRLKYKRVFLNSGVTQSAFRLQYPRGTLIENIDKAIRY